jgi:DNA ligase (NAD+)
MLEYGVEVYWGEEKKGPLSGKVFVFTGELDCCPRSKAKEMVEELGGQTADTVSKRVHYLVVGKNPGSKLQKAQKLGIRIISEEEFLKMLEEAKKSI